MQCFSLSIIITLFAAVAAVNQDEGTQLKTHHIRGVYDKLTEASNISVEQAESACSSRLDDPQDIKGCADYVAAAQDLDMVAEYLILRAYEPEHMTHRKLLEKSSVSIEQAETACSERLDQPHLIEACTAYVVAAQDMDAVGDYLILKAYYQPEELDGDEVSSAIER